MRSSVAVAFATLIAGAAAVPTYGESIFGRSETTGTCTGSAKSTLTGEQCAQVAGGATGFFVDGSCLSIKMAGSSLYKHKSGDCYKKIGGASGSGQASGSGHASGSGSRTPRVRARSYDDIVDEIVARAVEDKVASTLVSRSETAGTCTGPKSTLTGEQCAQVAGGAIGFFVDGTCLSIKMAGSSLYKHKSGDCYKKIAGASGSGQASGSGHASGSGSRTTRVRARSYDDIVGDIVARAVSELETRAYEDELTSMLVSRSDNSGTCTGSAKSTLTGGQCGQVAGGAVGFMLNGQCMSIKLAGSSLYKHQTGECYKRVN